MTYKLKINCCSSRAKFFHIFFVALMMCITIHLNAQQMILTPGSYIITGGSASLVAYNAAINNNGTFAAGNGTVVFAGYSDTVSSYITGSSTTTLNNIIVDKHAYALALKSPVHVTNTLTMTTGNLYTNDNLTLISSAVNTAKVASVPVSCSISGKANVQRFIPARRAWRLLTAPVTSSNTIYSAWQNNGVFTPGIGTLITKPNPTAGDGMDAGVNANYSMKNFNASTQGLINVANTMATKISAGTNGSADNTGYFIFIRSDRNPASVGNPGTSSLPCVNTTLSSFGKLQTGTQTFTASSSLLRYTLVGNPYASPIDFNNVTRTNVIKRFYVWDPNLNQVGGFVVLDDIFNTGSYTKSSAASSQTNEIQSGQSFFIQTLSNGSASFTVNENSKSATNNTVIFRPALGMQSIAAELYLVNSDSVAYADGALIQFNEAFDTAIDWQDAVKLGNVNEGIGFLRNSKNLAIERRPGLTINDTLFLHLTATTARNYQFEFNANNLQSSGLIGILTDKYLGTTTPVNLSGVTKINFSVIAGAAASAAADRFMIVFRTLGITPVLFTNVYAYKKNKANIVSWKVENEMNIAQYEIERSSDGKNFISIDNMIATGNNNSAKEYDWLDEKPFSGDNYYRIESIDKNGMVKYSMIVRISKSSKESNISIYPNPVIDHIINIQFNDQPTGKYTAHLINNNGQLVYEKEMIISSSRTSTALPVSPILAKGIYELRIETHNQKEIIQRINIQ